VDFSIAKALGAACAAAIIVASMGPPALAAPAAAGQSFADFAKHCRGSGGSMNAGCRKALDTIYATAIITAPPDRVTCAYSQFWADADATMPDKTMWTQLPWAIGVESILNMYGLCRAK
jgi:hypothetical protein